MRFWWVNHKATFRHEIDGGFLWSPKREKAARSQFYDNMRIVRPGDFVLSYAFGQLAHVGIATDPALDSPRPHEFGASGAAWDLSGWMLPVQWTTLPQPVRPQDFWEQLKPLLPQERYSPLVLATGRGSQKAYLSEIDEAAFNLILTRAGSARPSQPELSRLADILDTLERQVERDILESGDTEREQLILARRGQGRFRANVCKFAFVCRLTGISDPRLLVASHIKPWRVCTDARERLDGANGIMLTPNADRLFDRGLMTFDNNGEAMFSSTLKMTHLQQLGLIGANQRKATPFHDSQRPYLDYHRANVFSD